MRILLLRSSTRVTRARKSDSMVKVDSKYVTPTNFPWQQCVAQIYWATRQMSWQATAHCGAAQRTRAPPYPQCALPLSELSPSLALPWLGVCSVALSKEQDPHWALQWAAADRGLQLSRRTRRRTRTSSCRGSSSCLGNCYQWSRNERYFWARCSLPWHAPTSPSSWFRLSFIKRRTAVAQKWHDELSSKQNWEYYLREAIESVK